MRSRLEALWAAHFDNDPGGEVWRYEPRCFADQRGQYLPDFGLYRDDGSAYAYVEVKPRLQTCQQVEAVKTQMGIIWSSEPDATLFLYVGPPDGYLQCWGDEGTWDKEPW